MRRQFGLGSLAVICFACGSGTPIVERVSAVGGSTSVGNGDTGGAFLASTDYPISTASWTERQGSWNATQAPADASSQLSSLATLATMTTDQLVARSSGALNGALGYAPEKAEWLDVIQKSALQLNATELDTYNKKGFVISNRLAFPNFFAGYEDIYVADLPIFVSADSILYAFHRSYDKILSKVEAEYLLDALTQMLSSLRAAVPSASIGDDAKHDLGLLLGVAAGLLDAKAADIDAEMSSLIQQATAATGIATVSLFGSNRDIDFSQFVPRGHYTTLWGLDRYFRAMMWLGRTELRLVDVSPSGIRNLVRREVEDVLALRELFSSDTLKSWDSIDHVVGLFVGEPDYMTVRQIQKLHDDLGIGASTDLANVSDQKLLDVIDAGGFGLQRISSQLMRAEPGMTMLPCSFSLLGQRYTVDSHVFSKIVYPNSSLLMPNPLDVAFAALGNDQTAGLLRSRLDTDGYAPQLAQARQLVEWHGADYWNSSLYTFWISGLRQISSGKYDTSALPAIAKTDAWARRLLNAQLASWAELRHDTLLYAKQSYTAMPLCDYPDGYVDPYPGLFGRLREMSTFATQTLTTALPAESALTPTVVQYFQNLTAVFGRLENLATEELTGSPRSREDLDFLNNAVVTKSKDVICSSVPYPDGWYAKVFFDPYDAFDSKPTIADVHTQPADAAGNVVGKVLHVATGYPRLMVTSVDSCSGPRAYVGVVSAYFERITENFERETDEQWGSEIQSTSPSEVDWMQDLVVR